MKTLVTRGLAVAAILATAAVVSTVAASTIPVTGRAYTARGMSTDSMAVSLALRTATARGASVEVTELSPDAGLGIRRGRGETAAY